jgi:hypothetical protein
MLYKILKGERTGNAFSCGHRKKSCWLKVREILAEKGEK